MSDLLSIGGNSVKNNQSALTVVSNNIANVHTEGYVRQDLSLQENLPHEIDNTLLFCKKHFSSSI